MLSFFLFISFFSITVAKFFTAANPTNILNQISLLTLVATGLCFAVACDGIDLSVAFDLGSMAAIMVLKLRLGWYVLLRQQ